MKTLAALIVRAAIAVALLVATCEGVRATPFADVPANHWAYQAIQSLAADGLIDGYPDGQFKGDRPLTRYEMAVIVARAIAKLQENQAAGLKNTASKTDLEQLQKLTDALKDELDALGVRVTNLEDSVSTLDARTKFAQSLSMHGVVLPNASLRQRTTEPLNTNGTGTLNALATAYVTTDETNDPITSAPATTFIRSDDRFSLDYAISPNLAVSLPVHIINYEYGGTTGQQVHYDIEPSLDVRIARAGALNNLELKYGVLDNLQPSRLGLAFSPPAGDQSPPYYEAPQPFLRGATVAGTLMGLTDVQVSFARVDDTRYNTYGTGIYDPGGYGTNGYLYPIVAPQFTYTQPGGAQVPGQGLQSDTFNAGTGVLSQVYLSKKAQSGTVYVSQYNGSTFSSSGTLVAQSPGGPTAPPPFQFNIAWNSVFFPTPLPAGSSVTITYVGLEGANNSAFQRYLINARVNQRFKGYAGGELGLTFNRIYDQDEANVTSNVTTLLNGSPDGYGVISDTVLGVDFQAPIPLAINGPGTGPVLFGETAVSKFTPDYRNVPAVSDSAGVFGLRLKIRQAAITAQYQVVGTNFIAGAPFQYFGPTPTTLTQYRLPYFPDFYGIGNNLGINQQFDAAAIAAGRPDPGTRNNPNLTYAYPVFNPFRTSFYLRGGGEWYTNFVPNTQGISTTATVPVRIGGTLFNTRLNYQHLQELRPNAGSTLTYLPAPTSNVKAQFDSYGAGTTFSTRLLGTQVTLNLSGAYERLRRPDTTAVPGYVPIDITTGLPDPAAAAVVGALGPGALPSYFPNYVNMNRYVYEIGASLPLTHDLGLDLTYSSQRFGGAYGTTNTQNISQRKDLYAGSFTYNIPNTNSSVGLIYRHYSFSDDVLPTTNFSQSREDLNWSVRF